MFGRLIGITVHDSRNDFAAMARACEEAIAFFDRKPYQSGLSLQVFYNHLITAYLHTREFSRLEANLSEVSGWWEEGSYNWFKLQELYFFVAMHEQRYAEAFAIYRLVQEQPQFAQLPAPLTELWKILEAYVCFLALVGKIPGDLEGQAKFKVNRFLNEVPVFSKDKRGMNISLLVLQFLFALAQGRHELREERVEALNKYRTRYLGDGETVRSNLFIRMLACIPQCAFNLPRVVQKTEKLEQALLQAPPETVTQHYEVEVIPYDHLWPMALSCL
jgi:hypothetical protein